MVQATFRGCVPREISVGSVGGEGHFARSCPGHNGSDWGEVDAQGATDAPVLGQERGSVDLRDNQLDELSSQDAPGSATSSVRSADPDSLTVHLAALRYFCLLRST